MLPRTKLYEIYPSVVPSDTETEFTVVPTERSFLLFEKESCTVTLVDVDGDEERYHDPESHVILNATAEGGVLRFRHAFKSEGEHLVILTRENGNAVCEMGVYSLYPDLMAKMPLKGDLHSHSFRSDGERDPAALAGHYREQGYDFLALTDHNRAYPGDEIDEVYEGSPVNFARVYGEEVHAPGSVVHIVHVGGKSSVAELYVKDPESYERQIGEYLPRVPATLPKEYHLRYAKAMWACDKIHEAGGLAILAHPYWRPKLSKCYNVRGELAVALLKSGMFDAYELIGGMGQDGNNLSVVLWSQLRAEGSNISVVGSSDVHSIEMTKTFPYNFTVCFADKNESGDIIEAVKQGMSVAVEASGYDHTAEYRAYGSLRLVSYVNFLLKSYFPERKRICAAEGIAMRAYAMKRAPMELLTLLSEQSELYRKCFFGLCEAPLPTAELLEFIEEKREIQKSGPSGKGARIDTNNLNI